MRNRTGSAWERERVALVRANSLEGDARSGTVWLLREKWNIATVKINNGKEYNPTQREDGTYSVEGAAARLGVFPGTVHKWLKGGKLSGYPLAKGMPWKVYLTEEDMTRLQEWLRRARRVSKEEVL